MAEQGFTTLAEATLCENETPRSTLSSEGYEFLKTEFAPARDRMASLATTVGTTGSFLLAILALLGGLATDVGKESDELVTASEKAFYWQRSVSRTPSPECTEQKLGQAQAEVERERDQVSESAVLNAAQALVGAAALLGFLFSLGAHLTNPVPGPQAHVPPENNVDGRVQPWLNAVDRLKVKRHWIEAAGIAQAIGVAAVFYLAYEVFC